MNTRHPSVLRKLKHSAQRPHQQHKKRPRDSWAAAAPLPVRLGASNRSTRSAATVVIPSYPPHIQALREQLGSWARYAIDAASIRFHIIVSPGEVKLFADAFNATDLALTVLDVRTVVKAQDEHFVFRSDKQLFK